MWFSYALHKEKIIHMFDNAFEIKDIELGGFNFYNTSSVRFSFIVKGIPEIHPVKWAGSNYNAMILILAFDGIKKFNANGFRVNFLCSPEINSSAEFASININHADFNLSCESQFLTIESISPYIDERWD